MLNALMNTPYRACTYVRVPRKRVRTRTYIQYRTRMQELLHESKKHA